MMKMQKKIPGNIAQTLAAIGNVMWVDTSVTMVSAQQLEVPADVLASQSKASRSYQKNCCINRHGVCQ